MLHIGNKSINLAVKKASVLYIGTRKMGPIIPFESSTGKTLHLWDVIGETTLKAVVYTFFTDNNNNRYAVCCTCGGIGRYRWGDNGSVGSPYPQYSSGADAYKAKVSATWFMDEIKKHRTISSDAFGYCNGKSLIVEGITYKGLLPNMYELKEIWNNRSTIASFRSNESEKWSIENWIFGGTDYRHAWSAAEESSYYAWCISQYGGYSNGSGPKYNFPMGVIPIFEIPVDENGRVITN